MPRRRVAPLRPPPARISAAPGMLLATTAPTARGRPVRCSASNGGAAGGKGDASADVLRVRVAKARLQDAYDKSVRRRKPRYLPFDEARKWARAMWMTNESDWDDWILDGRRSAYIPSQPEVVYADDGWNGWQDFLNGCEKRR